VILPRKRGRGYLVVDYVNGTCEWLGKGTNLKAGV